VTEPELPEGPTTAEELVRWREELLRADPDYRARSEAIEAKREERARLLNEAERPIVADLNGSDVSVSSVWDLVNTSVPYPDALPILLAHLKRGGYPERVMESLGRALAVKPAVVWWDDLKRLYLSARDPGEENGTAVALAARATRAQVDDLIAFLKVEERGESRIYFLPTSQASRRGAGTRDPRIVARRSNVRSRGDCRAARQES
jgi:hypothetical protein